MPAMELEQLKEVVNRDEVRENDRKTENRPKKERRRKSRNRERTLQETDLNNASERKDNILKGNRHQLSESDYYYKKSN